MLGGIPRNPVLEGVVSAVDGKNRSRDVGGIPSRELKSGSELS